MTSGAMRSWTSTPEDLSEKIREAWDADRAKAEDYHDGRREEILMERSC